ncbi:MAG: hypothetical protein ACLVEJ_30980 [Parabacteroides sp.]
METDFLTAQQSEDLQKLSGNPSPLSEEELKDFYLKLARLVNPNACSANRSDFEVLNILCKDLKRNLGILCKYTQHAWDEGILDLQMACRSIPYSSSKERLDMMHHGGLAYNSLAQMASPVRL